MTQDRASPSKPLLIILSGPSGVGKDTILTRMKEAGHSFHYAITATTRPPRPQEQNGVDYQFLSKQQFQQKIAQNQLLEWAEVYGNYYGVPKEEVEVPLKRGQDVIVKVDVQGAATIKRLFPEAVAIFLVAPSEEELVQRLKQRHTKSPTDLDQRLKAVQQEMKSLPLFDHVVINRKDKLDESIAQIEAIIAAEKR